ncbi:hypothetical protein MNBD_ALPHA07-1374 [hydrothermal vent metagenome]|uniref:Uncharacterized protein n=1 Tax=hydrothermal vent metagenome TaxID=652676 RepID=A0A3B0RF67_9ZZZZ
MEPAAGRPGRSAKDCNHNIGDETLKTALEDALRDLALMLDSLESGESVGHPAWHVAQPARSTISPPQP